MHGVFVSAEHLISTRLQTPHKNELDYVTRHFNASLAGQSYPCGWTYAETPLYVICNALFQH
jgi:hypothetical protein